MRQQGIERHFGQGTLPQTLSPNVKVDCDRIRYGDDRDARGLRRQHAVARILEDQRLTRLELERAEGCQEQRRTGGNSQLQTARFGLAQIRFHARQRLAAFDDALAGNA